MRARVASRVALAIVLASALFAGAASARPGGGGHFSSGSRGGGGFRSGGGGFHTSSGYHGGGLDVGCGGDAFVVLVVLTVVVALAARRRGERFDRTTRAAILVAQDDAAARLRRRADLEPLRARDPALTSESIDARVRRMNTVLVEAWCAGDMRPARPFVSDGVFARFQVQLALMRAEGARNAMRDAEALFVTIEGVETVPPLDVVHVRFTARARDVDVSIDASADDVARALDRAPLEEYSEIWSLIRRGGAKTARDASDLGRACPACGAPIPIEGEMLKCRYCDAVLCSGEHDWVLAEITQVSEWHPGRVRVEGLDASRARDPELVRELLEDRASYLFWKWVEAARRGSTAPLAKGTTPELLARSQARLARLKGARDVAVGGADLVLVETDRGAMDHALVKIFWSARTEGSREPLPEQSVVRLARRAGVKSRASISALACPGCGAPIGERDTPSCDHCGVVLAAGDHDWVLEAIEAPGVLEAEAMRARTHDDPMRESLVPNVIDPRERGSLFRQMAAMASADGWTHGREQRLLDLCARRWDIPRATVHACLASPRDPSDAERANPEWFLSGLVEAALIDGVLDLREKAVLERACDSLQLPREDLARLIAASRERSARRERDRSRSPSRPDLGSRR